ncbi:MAG: 16S rRNA (cytosine(1402)-N(4))-methyltransferase RsmH [Patescibacteria group bacterium]|mgnify:FL=1
MIHIPVLANEVLRWLDPKPNQNFIDGTVGLGGHAALILEATSPNGRLLAFDRDAANLAKARQNLSRFGDRVEYVNDSYATLKKCAYDRGFNQVDGILLDLGFSSVHIEDPTRGFSFQNAGPLDMRYDLQQALTAEEIVNTWSVGELGSIFRKLGEERHAHKIAERIVEARQKTRIVTTDQLVDIIGKRSGPIHPATRVFQALRIAVNDELHELNVTLPQTLDVLIAGGRLAVISFHSLEDRPVKQFIKAHAGKELLMLTKRPIIATEQEVKNNPRSRSAKLRVAERVGGYEIQNEIQTNLAGAKCPHF